jgi:predicted small lipoprotein YifL
MLRCSRPIVLAVLVVIAGCGGDGAESNPPATISSTTRPATTTTQATTTTVPSAHVATFDGITCVVEGPNQLSTGTYLFELVDQSQEDLDLFVIRFLPGHTLADEFDFQGEPGRWYPKPSRLAYTADSLRTKTDGGETVRIALADEGEHAVYVTNYYKASPSERRLWFCSPSFQVVGDSS